mmetsp:Transcript_11937/g.22112  ORF Transcript_11937/g.22112 Transcript_11937/m.22112 type:complete len:482 (-) Transcript_11937:96-1541(-)
MKDERQNELDRGLIAELWLFGAISGPSVFVSLGPLLQWTYTASTLGSTFGSEALTGFTLANLSGNLTGLSVILGLLSACETLEPQAFAKKQYREVGHIAARGILLCLVFVSLLVPIWLNIGDALIYAGQPEVPSRLAQRFLKLYCVAFPGVVFNESAWRFYRSQSVVRPALFTTFASVVLHPFWVNVFVHGLGLGFDGAPLAHVTTVYSQSLCTVLLLRHGDFHFPGTLPSDLSLSWLKEVLDTRGMWRVLQLGIPGVLAMSEWWYWEINCFMSGTFGTASLAAHTIAYQLVPLCYMIPSGFASGITTRVSSLLALRQVALAKRLTKFAFTAVSCLTVGTCTCIYLAEDFIVSFFSSEEEVVGECATIWFFVAFLIWFDGLLSVQTGLLRALALQGRTSGAVLVALWCFGLPLTYYLAVFQGLGLYGIWQGMVCAYVVLNLILFLSYCTFDWDACSESIIEELNNHKGYELTKSKVSDEVL